MKKWFFLCLILFVTALSACTAPPSKANPPATGDALFHSPTLGENYAPGCSNCHMLDADIQVGPSLRGIATRAEATLASSTYLGTATTAEEYIRESILDPEVHIVAGFPSGLMYAGYEEDLTVAEIDLIVGYLLMLE